jgi:hypothetical protein
MLSFNNFKYRPSLLLLLLLLLLMNCIGRLFLEKLIVDQQVKKFPEFYATRKSVVVYHSTVARGSPYFWGMNRRLVGGHSSQTESHPIDMNNNK